MKTILPDFIGIGTQKGGTTTLHRLLEQHPQVFLPKCKELHYFDLNYEKGDEWYRKHFDMAGRFKCYGEITPHYLFHLETPLRIKKTVPNVKMIILLRDPIKRTLSHFYHAKKRGFEHLTLKEALEAEPQRMKSANEKIRQRHSYISRSKYIAQLERYEKLFGPDQILIQKSEDLFSNQYNTFGNILKYLNLEDMRPLNQFVKENKGNNNAVEADPKIIIKLREVFDSTYNDIENKYGFKG